MTATLSPGQRVRVRPDAPLYAGREGRVESRCPDGWRVRFTEFQLLGKSHVYDEAHLSPVRKTSPTIRGAEVRPGDLIGLGPGLALRVEQVIFDGDDGLLVGRAECDGPLDNDRHGVLRPGQPYAAVVSADGELSWLEGYHPDPVVIW